MEVMSRAGTGGAFRFEGVNRSNAVVNFTEEDPIDPKALWLNSQHIFAMPVDELAKTLAAGRFALPAIKRTRRRCCKVTPLIRERIRTAERGCCASPISSSSMNCRPTIRQS